MNNIVKDKITIDVIADAVYRRWLDSGDASTVKELAEELAVPWSVIHSRINAAAHFVPDCAYTEKAVTVYDRSFSTPTPLYERLVRAWEPSREKLRAIIRFYAVQRPKIQPCDLRFDT